MSAVRILRLAAGGDGVGRLDDGRTVFVPRTRAGRPGRAGRAARAQALRPRPARPAARALARPGRAALSALRATTTAAAASFSTSLAPAQREARRGFVGDALRRLAQLRRGRSRRWCRPTREFEYRTKITLAVSADGRRIGLHRYDRAERGLRAATGATSPCRSSWSCGRRSAGCARSSRRGSRALVLRMDREGGRHVLFRTAGGEVLERRPQLHAELAARSVAGDALVAAGGRAAGHGGRRTRPYPATVFEQVHPAMGDRVRAHAVAALGRVAGRHVWDLYAGIGETTAALARAGAVGGERRVGPARGGGGRGRGPRRGALAGRVEDVLATLRRAGSRHHQPAAHRDGRAGHRGARAAGARAGRLHLLRPGHAGAGPRPAPGLPARRRWRVRSFPQTAHVETVAVLDRAS